MVSLPLEALHKFTNAFTSIGHSGKLQSNLIPQVSRQRSSIIEVSTLSLMFSVQSPTNPGY